MKKLSKSRHLKRTPLSEVRAVAVGRPAPRAKAKNRRAAQSAARTTTAFHESAHAVTGRALGFGIGVVTIEGDDDGDGSVIVFNPLVGWTRGDGPRREIAERYILSLYAGGAADRNRGCESAWYGDYDQARHWIDQCIRIRGCRFTGDDAYERYEQRMRDAALALVRRHWSDIERIAGLLLRRGSLEGDVVVAELRRKTKALPGVAKVGPGRKTTSRTTRRFT